MEERIRESYGEYLGREYTLPQFEDVEKSVPVKLLMSADLGSTATRTMFFDKSLSNLKDTLILESGYSVIDQDLSWSKSRSKLLYDNLEIELEDITEGKGDFKMFDKVRLIKGGLLKDFSFSVQKHYSSNSKVDNVNSYINLLVNIGIKSFNEQCLNFQDTIISKVIADVTVALPATDTQSANRINKFASRLAGVYKFTLVRLGFSVKIEIHEDDILVEDEAVASLRFWASTKKDGRERVNDTTLVIDGGGSTSDLAILKDGRTLKNGSISFPVGGIKLEEIIFKHYLSDIDDAAPTASMVGDSLRVGYLVDGTESINMQKYIKAAKRDMVVEYMNAINEVLTNTRTSLKEVANIVCTGGCFRETATKEDRDLFIPSLSVYLAEKVKEVSKNTEITRIRNSNSILLGLALYRISELIPNED